MDVSCTPKPDSEIAPMDISYTPKPDSEIAPVDPGHTPKPKDARIFGWQNLVFSILS